MKSRTEDATVVDHLAAPRTSIVLVGDNRTNPNWGRGASIALYELLSMVFEVKSSVSGECFDLDLTDAGFIRTIVPPSRYHILRHIWRRRRRRPFSWYWKLERLLGAKDFISKNPAESVANLLKNKDRYEGLGRIYDSVVQSDAVIVDGDGDIIFSTPPRRQTLFVLAMIALGQQLGKPVCVVNTMISDCPTTGRNQETLRYAKELFGRCRYVLLRDPDSYEYVRRAIPEARSGLLPDSLFFWHSRYSGCKSAPPTDGDSLLPFPEDQQYWGRLDFSVPYICIGGGAQASSDPERATRCYLKLVQAIKKMGLSVCLIESDTPDAFLRRVANEAGVGIIPVNAPILLCGAVLAHARLFISGRYHPSIFASLGGTPCIFLASHAHKMGSLARLLEYQTDDQFSAFPEDVEIALIVAVAAEYLRQGDDLRRRIGEIARRRCEEVTKLPNKLAEQLDGRRIALATASSR